MKYKAVSELAYADPSNVERLPSSVPGEQIEQGDCLER
jgi:hypothetical protein